VAGVLPGTALTGPAAMPESAAGNLAGDAVGAAERTGAGAIGKGAQECEIAAKPQSFPSFDALKRALGPAGDGKVWHHIVEQRAANIEKFGAEAIHNTQNVVAVPREINQAIADYYSRKRAFTSGQTVRQWLGSKSLEQQRAFGVRILDLVQNGGTL